MPVGRIIRHSPLYLYLKLYSLSVLVSLFASRPVTGRLSGQTLQQIDRIRLAAKEAVVRRLDADGKALTLPSAQGKHVVRSITRRDDFPYSLTRQGTTKAAILDHEASLARPSDKILARLRTRHPFPYAIKTLALDADTRFPAVPLHGALQRVTRVFRRWGRRLRDLSLVKRTVQSDRQDIKRYPEMALEAQVRCSASSHASEQAFIQARAQHIASDSALLDRVGIHVSLDDCIHPGDIPRVALGGSGGGYRATFGFLASLRGLHVAGVYDTAFWLAGVSGSCWTIASLYTVAQRNPNDLLAHYMRVAAEALHPMCRGALDVVARSPKGVYFLLAPLLSKLRDGNVGIGIMDMYATLTTSYQLLSRSPHARPRLSRSTFEFSKVWERSGLQDGKAPMPILTAVRILRRGDAEEDLGSPKADVRDASSTSYTSDDRYAKTRFQWWEMNPLEVGSSDEAAWVPTWSYGRAFVSGRSVSTAPEISLSLLLGQATSAPAGPLTGYISTLLATLPQGTLMSRTLALLNDFVRHKRWEKRWGNPIRGADEPNPLYGFGSRAESDGRGWEGRGRLKLMDSGMSNNLPNHIFMSKARQADIILAFDQSSDVQTGAGWARLDDFAKERNVLLMPAPDLGYDRKVQRLPSLSVEAQKIHDRFCDSYAQVFRAWRVDEDADAHSACLMREGEHGMPDRPADLYLIYCPLLPNACQPDFDPVTATFSTSYNLIWKPDEIGTLAKTATANTSEYVVPVLGNVYQRVYQQRRALRMAKEKADAQHVLTRGDPAEHVR